MSLIAIIFGLIGLVSQPQALPQDFTDGATQRSEPVVVEGFVGIEWTCDVVIIEGRVAKPSDLPRDAEGHPVTEDEMCYAGIDTTTGEAVTGP